MAKLIKKYQQGKKLVRTTNGTVVDITPYYGKSGYEKYSKMADEYQPKENPEYNKFIEDLNNSYLSGRTSGNYLNFKNYQSQLPEGYTINQSGVITDKQGNAYVQAGFNGGTRFNYANNPYVDFTFNQGKPIERNERFYQVATPNRYIDEQVYPVQEEDYLKNLAEQYIKDNTKSISNEILIPGKNKRYIEDTIYPKLGAKTGNHQKTLFADSPVDDVYTVSPERVNETGRKGQDYRNYISFDSASNSLKLTQESVKPTESEEHAAAMIDKYTSKPVTIRREVGDDFDVLDFSDYDTSKLYKNKNLARSKNNRNPYKGMVDTDDTFYSKGPQFLPVRRKLIVEQSPSVTKTESKTITPTLDEAYNNVHVNSMYYTDADGNKVEFRNGGKIKYF